MQLWETGEPSQINDKPGKIPKEFFEDRAIDWNRFRPLFEAGIVVIGDTVTTGPFRSFTQDPELALISACVEGEGEAYVDGKWVPFPAGTAYCVPRHIARGYRSKTPGFRVVWVITVGSHLRPQAVNPTHTILQPSPSGALIELLFRCLYHESRTQADPMVMTQTIATLARVLRRMVTDKEENHRLLTLWQAVDTQLDHPWTLEELANLAGMSTERLRQLSLAETEKSPLAYVQYLRLQRACTMLMDREMKISTVALKVGYSNADAFSSAFRKRYGKTPSEFRQSPFDEMLP